MRFPADFTKQDIEEYEREFAEWSDEHYPEYDFFAELEDPDAKAAYTKTIIITDGGKNGT